MGAACALYYIPDSLVSWDEFVTGLEERKFL